MTVPCMVRALKLSLLSGLLVVGALNCKVRAAAAPPTVCVLMASAEWPQSRSDRQRMLRDMDSLSERCDGSAAFLALLGALWLEEGEAAQAMLWLERAILLDPAVLGARVDHALALAALGQPAARDELLGALASRDDVPASVIRRLRDSALPAQALQTADTPARMGRWLQRGEVSVKHGSDSNLDRSPALDGITLTSPDGPIELPLAIPLRPREGQASVGELAWRVAYDTGQGALWQLSAALAARRATSESDTDWQYLQVRVDHWRAWGPWRAQLQSALGHSTGPLDEPYSAYRFGAALEYDHGACTGRAALEIEARRLVSSRYLDGDLLGGLASWECRLPWAPHWQVGAEVKASSDRPKSAERPGGRQRQAGATVRISGKVSGFDVELSGNQVRADENEGFSPLLQNNARRSFRQSRLNLEISRPVRLPPVGPAVLFIQWSDARQTSNIELFSDAGTSAFAGLRWRW